MIKKNPKKTKKEMWSPEVCVQKNQIILDQACSLVGKITRLLEQAWYLDIRILLYTEKGLLHWSDGWKVAVTTGC